MLLPPANVVCEGYVFTGVCHSFCSQGGRAWFYSGGRVWFYPGGAWFYSGGVHGFIWGGMRGFIWGGVRGFIRGACVVLFGGGMHGFIWGACVVLFGGACMVLFGGHAWFYSGGHAWFYSGGRACFYSGGACVVFPVFFGYNEIRSMSGRYASYWNAFLFHQVLSLLLLDCSDRRKVENVLRQEWKLIQHIDCAASVQQRFPHAVYLIHYLE